MHDGKREWNECKQGLFMFSHVEKALIKKY